MTTSQHISAGIILSQAITNPLLAFCIGIASHAGLDMLPVQEPKININNLSDNRELIAAEIIISLIIIYLSIDNVVMMFALIGTVLPDVIDGILSAIKPDRYQSGNHLFWFHRPGKSDNITQEQSIILSSILLIIVTAL